MAKKGKSSRAKRSKPTKKKAGLSFPDLIQMMDSLGLREALEELTQPPSRRRDKRTPLEKARDLVRKAEETEDLEKQVRLIQQALETSPDCSEAYLALGQLAPSEREAIPMFEEAVRATERVLGKETFEQDAGYFWGVHKTRPYMEARLELARALWLTGRAAEAVDHLRDMLRLNPGDNQGVRYLLVAWLIELKRNAEAQECLDRFDDSSTFWAFNKALCAFCREGDTAAARKLLSAARKENKHVTPVLLGEMPMVPMVFPMYAPGDESEAMTYLSEAARAWRYTPGAISWLRRVVAEVTDRKNKPSKAAGPTAASKSLVKKQPQEYGEVWQAGIHQVKTWLTSGGQPVRPWSVLVVNHSDHKILFQEIVPFRPSAHQLWEFVCEAVRAPHYGKPHRPSEIQVREEPAWEEIRPHLEEVGIDCIYPAELEEFDFLVRDLDRFMADSEDAGRAITLVPGVSTGRAASLYAAAAAFYRQAPWRTIADDLTIKVECPELTAEPAYAVVMGNGGMMVGLAVYRDLQSLHETRFPSVDDADSTIPRVAAVTLMFGEPFELAVPDLAAIEQHGWDIASPEAYPTFMAVHRERGPAMPDIRELTLIEACLRSAPEFVLRCGFIQPYSERQTVPVAGREYAMTLSWDPAVEGPCGEACTGRCSH